MKPPVKHGFVDHETGLIHLPSGDLPLVGPTSGMEYEQLKRAEPDAKKARWLIERYLRSILQCTQCKRKFSHFNPSREREILCRAPRIRWLKVEGRMQESLVCFDPACDGPVIVAQDILELRDAPGGRI
jgi:hypothetical protein